MAEGKALPSNSLCVAARVAAGPCVDIPLGSALIDNPIPGSVSFEQGQAVNGP